MGYASRASWHNQPCLNPQQTLACHSPFKTVAKCIHWLWTGTLAGLRPLKRRAVEVEPAFETMPLSLLKAASPKNSAEDCETRCQPTFMTVLLNHQRSSAVKAIGTNGQGKFQMQHAGFREQVSLRNSECSDLWNQPFTQRIAMQEEPANLLLSACGIHGQKVLSADCKTTGSWLSERVLPYLRPASCTPPCPAHSSVVSVFRCFATAYAGNKRAFRRVFATTESAASAVRS